MEYNGYIIDILIPPINTKRNNVHVGRIVEFGQLSYRENLEKVGVLANFLNLTAERDKIKIGKILQFGEYAKKPDAVIQNITQVNVKTPRQFPLETTWKSKNPSIK